MKQNKMRSLLALMLCALLCLTACAGGQSAEPTPEITGAPEATPAATETPASRDGSARRPLFRGRGPGPFGGTPPHAAAHPPPPEPTPASGA